MSFLSLGFLFAALAAGIPVMLHMIHRQNLKELPFPTLRFIRISEQKTRNKRRVQDLLLLLLRMAVLILIAIGLARPIMRNLSDLWGGAKTSAVIIIDNSASMGSIDGNGVRIDTAMAAAERILDELGSGDRVAILVPCGAAFPENGQLYTSQQQVRRVLQQVKVTYERADLNAAVEQARHLLATADTPSKLIFVISDQQQVSWQAVAADRTIPISENQDASSTEETAPTTPVPAMPQEEAEAALKKIPIIFVNCFDAPKPNVALVRLDMRNVLPIAQVPIPMAVRLKNESTLEQTRRIEVYVDGVRTYGSTDIVLPSNEEMRHDFTIVFDRGGLHKGEVRLVGTDGNKYDDKLFFAFEVDQGIPVALVKGSTHEVPFLEDTFYMRSALSTGSGGISPVQLTVLTPETLADEPLTGYDAVICANMEAPNEETARHLVAYVERGGNLIWTVGDHVYSEAYNEINRQMQGKLLPAPLGTIQTPPIDEGKESWSVASLDGDYPAFRNLLTPRELYTSVLVYKRIPPLMADPLAGGQALATLDDGTPLILQRRVGQGSVTLFTTNLHVSWTNLPVKHIFLPMVSQMVFLLAGVEQTRLQTTAGTPLSFTFKEDELPKLVEITPPTGGIERHELSRLASGTANRYLYPGTRQIGVYLIRAVDGPRPRQIPFSVNPDAEEADGRTIDEETLKKHFAGSTLVFTSPGEGIETTFTQLKSGTSLWDFFLTFVLIVLVVESYVSNRLTQRKSEQEKAVDVRRNLPQKPAVLGS